MVYPMFYGRKIRMFVLTIRLLKAFKSRVLLKLSVSLTMKTVLATKGNWLCGL